MTAIPHSLAVEPDRRKCAAQCYGQVLRRFLWGVDEQSGFNDSTRRMHRDQKSMMWRNRLDFVSLQAFISIHPPHDSERVATFRGTDESPLLHRFDGIAVGTQRAYFFIIFQSPQHWLPKSESVSSWCPSWMCESRSCSMSESLGGTLAAFFFAIYHVHPREGRFSTTVTMKRTSARWSGICDCHREIKFLKSLARASI
jgi:hypothetical protein